MKTSAAIAALMMIVACAGGGSRQKGIDRIVTGRDDVRFDTARDDHFHSGGYIILLHRGVDAGVILQCLREYQPVLVRRSVTENMYLVNFRKDPGLPGLLDMIKNCSGIAGISHNVRPGPYQRGH